MKHPTKAPVVGVITPTRGRPLPPLAPARRCAIPDQDTKLRCVGRPDRHSADIIDSGLAILATHGLLDAAVYLGGLGIAPATILRVLERPERRRSATAG